MFKRIIDKKKFLQYLNSYPRFSLGSLLIAVCCAFLIVTATFTQLKLSVLSVSNLFVGPADFIEQLKNSQVYYYIPQVPIVLFIGALLGPRIGLLSALIYLAAGLAGFPVFASGGGLDYYKQPGFGYILGYFVAIYLTGSILRAKASVYSILRAGIIGILAVHLVGIIYLLASILMFKNSLYSVMNWILALSGIQIPYDIIIGFIAISLARPIRGLLWVVLD